MKERIVYTVYLLNSTRQYIIETIYAYNYLSLKWHARDLTRTNITRQNHSNIHSLNISLPLRSDRDQQKQNIKKLFLSYDNKNYTMWELNYCSVGHFKCTFFVSVTPHHVQTAPRYLHTTFILNVEPCEGTLRTIFPRDNSRDPQNR